MRTIAAAKIIAEMLAENSEPGNTLHGTLNKERVEAIRQVLYVALRKNRQGDQSEAKPK
ncbi:MAG TPA: hypothetical protein VMJ93_14635 [Verrucomicrobiae bacterium]|nr:hypothetical protein [Verrucomicrobiae bacterium]